MLKPLGENLLRYSILTYSRSISHTDCYGLWRERSDWAMGKSAKCHSSQVIKFHITDDGTNGPYVCTLKWFTELRIIWVKKAGYDSTHLPLQKRTITQNYCRRKKSELL